MDVSNLRKSTGLTLVELLIVLAIAAILAQIALPDFSDIIKNNRATARINELQTSLTFARTEAVKRNTPVVLCQSATGTSCQDDGSDWHSGWIVFVDKNNNYQVDQNDDPEIDEPILSLHGNAKELFTLTFTETRVSYAGNGLATQGQDGIYLLCDDRGEKDPEPFAKGVLVTPTGRPSLLVDSDDDKIVDTAPGKNVACA